MRYKCRIFTGDKETVSKEVELHLNHDFVDPVNIVKIYFGHIQGGAGDYYCFLLYRFPERDVKVVV